MSFSSFSIPHHSDLDRGMRRHTRTSGTEINVKARDAPQFIPAKIVLLVTQTAAALLAIALRIYYVQQNKARERAEDKKRESGELKQVTNIEWLNLTDRENETFRYKY
ncbi:hypothetical protein C8R43DRAFT_978654 [Mycena crocata]|nr:hypothetical protein C8R43DRAFT_978654 [Mycena crocata]